MGSPQQRKRRAEESAGASPNCKLTGNKVQNKRPGPSSTATLLAKSGAEQAAGANPNCNLTGNKGAEQSAGANPNFNVAGNKGAITTLGHKRFAISRFDGFRCRFGKGSADVQQ